MAGFLPPHKSLYNPEGEEKMSLPTIDDVIQKYIELRDRKAEIAKRHADELAPLSEGMGNIENYILHLMATHGVTQFKSPAGTAFKANATSCQMQDPLAFKMFVFQPASDSILNYLRTSGYDIRDTDAEIIAQTIRDLSRWDMVDFRAGKKGIQEYIANENMPVPGVAVNTVSTISVRRS